MEGTDCHEDDRSNASSSLVLFALAAAHKDSEYLNDGTRRGPGQWTNRGTSGPGLNGPYRVLSSEMPFGEVNLAVRSAIAIWTVSTCRSSKTYAIKFLPPPFVIYLTKLRVNFQRGVHQYLQRRCYSPSKYVYLFVSSLCIR